MIETGTQRVQKSSGVAVSPEKGGKLIPAEAASNFARFKMLMQKVGKDLKHLVTLSVSPEIVNRLEPVQIEINKAERRFMLIHRAEQFFAGTVNPRRLGMPVRLAGWPA